MYGLTVVIPERISQVSICELRQRSGFTRTVSAGKVEIGYSRAVPQEGNMAPIRRPHRIRRMLDVHQLLNAEPPRNAALLGESASRPCQGRQQHQDREPPHGWHHGTL